MPIPSGQLNTWANQGAITTSSNAYNSIRTALLKSTSPLANRDVDIFLQGSYGNATNIYGDSDVDVVVLYGDTFGKDMSSLTPTQQQLHESVFPPATYPWVNLRNDTLAALQAHYGAQAVTPGRKSIKVRMLSLFNWTPPAWADIPGAFTIFGILSWWFDRQIWRWPFVRRMGLSTPILDGKWSGVIRSSYDEFRTEYSVSMTIRQTWTTIFLLFAAGQSRSHSMTAAINVGPESLLVYSFTNEPEAGAVDTMHTHVGTAFVRILPGELVGEYYSGRDRQNIGTIRLSREKD